MKKTTKRRIIGISLFVLFFAIVFTNNLTNLLQVFNYPNKSLVTILSLIGIFGVVFYIIYNVLEERM